MTSWPALTPSAQRILDYAAKHPGPLTKTEVLAGTGLSRATFWRVIDALRAHPEMVVTCQQKLTRSGKIAQWSISRAALNFDDLGMVSSPATTDLGMVSFAPHIETMASTSMNHQVEDETMALNWENVQEATVQDETMPRSSKGGDTMALSSEKPWSHEAESEVAAKEKERELPSLARKGTTVGTADTPVASFFAHASEPAIRAAMERELIITPDDPVCEINWRPVWASYRDACEATGWVFQPQWITVIQYMIMVMLVDHSRADVRAALTHVVEHADRPGDHRTVLKFAGAWLLAGVRPGTEMVLVDCPLPELIQRFCPPLDLAPLAARLGYRSRPVDPRIAQFRARLRHEIPERARTREIDARIAARSPEERARLLATVQPSQAAHGHAGRSQSAAARVKAEARTRLRAVGVAAG